MFKKKPQVKSSSNIKSSERRNLLSIVCDTYRIDKSLLLKEEEFALFPAVTKQSTYHGEDQKGTIYFDSDEKPIWFRNRDSDLFPSIYTLWAISGILPVVLTNSFVIERLLDNANLMLPGCIPPFDKRMTKSCLVGIANYKTPDVVMAIGICALNLTQFDDVQGRQGTAVIVKHYVNDELFKLYDEKVAIPESILLTAQGSKLVDDQATVSLDETKDVIDEQSTQLEYVTLQEESPCPSSPAEDVDENEAEEELRVEDIDNFFVRSFIQAVKLNKMEFPISSSTFMSDYVLKNLPRIDSKNKSIKKTQWKKSAKFLKHLEKMDYLTLKGKGDDVSIISITVPQDLLQNFVTHKTGEAKGPSLTPSKKDGDNKLTVLSLYKPTKKSGMIFNSLDLNHNRLYTSPEVKAIINEYVKKNQLVSKKSPKLIDPDEAISAATSSAPGIPISRENICTAFLKGCSPHYTILLPGEEYSTSLAVKKGEPGKIKITTQTVLGRKKTTTVLNFEQFHIKPQKLADDLKNACSGSTAINPCKHNPSIMEVMVQGPHGNTVIDYLKSKGIPVSFIEFEDKSKGKKKK